MLQTRAIPCLLLKDRGFVKTVRFKDPAYLGDPINIVRLFNDKEADELIILDIMAARLRRPPQFEFLSSLTSECFMPLCYGGGISSIEDISRLLALGIEKVAINTAAIDDPDLIRKAADAFGSQAIVASIDVKKGWTRKLHVHVAGGKRNTGRNPAEVAAELAAVGAGEILVQSIDRDGTMAGYDLDLAKAVSSAVTVPVIISGGAGTLNHLTEAIAAGASAVAAGSLFVYHGPHRAVLVNYPGAAELRRIFS